MTTPDNRDEEAVDLAKLPGYLGYQIRQAQSAIFKDIEDKMKVLDVTPGEFGLLTLIDANPGIHQKTLARFYGLDKSTLSYSIGKLTDRKWISRKKSPEDGRYYDLWLTKAGYEKAMLATQYIEAQEDLMDSVLEKGERQQLLDMLGRIAAALKDDQSGVP